MRLIKKYPNRRLYDTGISSYITIDDVRQLIIDCEDFEVCDARTGEDLTRPVLLQVISEREHDGPPLLSSPLLMRLVRLHGDPRQREVSTHLEGALDRMGIPPASNNPECERRAPVASAPRAAPAPPLPESQNLTGSFGQAATATRRGTRDRSPA